MYAILYRLGGSRDKYVPVASQKSYFSFEEAHRALASRIRLRRYPSPFEFIISNGQYSKKVEVI